MHGDRLKRLSISILVCLILMLAGKAGAKDVYTIAVGGAINPPTASFISDAVTQAEQRDAEALVILLDTPGGLDSSMRQIVRSIMEAKVPVIVYVHPSGARAASAGAVILLASHVAAMTPGTNTGAAHPVAVGQGKPDKEMMEKVVKDAEAYARSIAIKRGRNVDWAASAIRESASLAATDALAKGVIDIVAENLEDLLRKLDGVAVETAKGKVVLQTKGKGPVSVAMPFKYRFLGYISDPNIAYILMMIGIYGILFEIYSPGAIFPGVAGGISLILALYAFQALPINYAGAMLILLGIIFFILEIKVVSYGMLGIAGTISIVVGSIMLIDLPEADLGISWKTIAGVATLTGIFFFGVLSYAVKAQLSKVKTGSEGIIGETGTVVSEVRRTGKVFLHGELWSATSEDSIPKGEDVLVTGVKGLVLTVKKKGGEQ